jgi:crotonobetainyl-CoA:carnitine CoA-transferase CaiB-like acyl-CoA transferase
MRRPKVVDFSTHISGPLAAGLLAQLGADVIKVENPKIGDGNRFVTPMVDDIGFMHWALNSGTRSIAVDRRSAAWPEIVAGCTKWADAVIIGMRPADASRIGLGFETLSAHNPDIVYCSISGYGARGPWSDYTGHGFNFDARAGVLPLQPGAQGPEIADHAVPVGPTAAGVFAALGVFAGLYQRQPGTPSMVEVSLWQTAMWWNFRNLTTLANIGAPMPRYRDYGSRYAVYRTADAREIIVAPIERKFWIEFCDVVDLPEARKSKGDWSRSGMDWGQDDDEEKGFIAARLATRSQDEWTAILKQTSIPFAPLLNAAEALQSEHAAAERVMIPLDGGQRIPRVPINFSGGPAQPVDTRWLPRTAPRIGEQTDEILDQVGLSHLRAHL